MVLRQFSNQNEQSLWKRSSETESVVYWWFGCD